MTTLAITGLVVCLGVWYLTHTRRKIVNRKPTLNPWAPQTGWLAGGHGPKTPPMRARGGTEQKE